MRVVVYTCIMGGYDRLIPPLATSGARFVCYADRVPLRETGWEIRAPLSPPGLRDPGLVNRWHRVFDHLAAPEADVSLYIDGNIRLLRPPQEIAAMLAPDSSIGALTHPLRTTVAEELEACISDRRLAPHLVPAARALLAMQAEAGFRDDQGLSVNHLLVRRPGDAALRRAMERWWDCIAHHAPRDQLSLQFALWSEGVRMQPLNLDLDRNEIARRFSHGAFGARWRRAGG